MSATILYNNLASKAISITENYSYPTYGTAYIVDGNLSTYYQGDVVTPTSILFNFGSAVYIDHVLAVTNSTTSSTGDILLTAGNTTATSSLSTGLFSNGYGTSYRDFGNYGYQYWKITMVAPTYNNYINEVFLGKKLVITELPSYPVERNIEEDTTELISERGQKWIYLNSNKENWSLNFENINTTTKNNLFNLYKYTKGNKSAFWINFDTENDPFNFEFFNIKDESFVSEEITKNIFNVNMNLEKII